MHFLSFLHNLTEKCHKDKSLLSLIESAFIATVEDKPTNYGAGILFICPSTKKILLVYRGNAEEDPHVWCSFGGKGEKGEFHLETAIRETEEEANITPNMYSIYPGAIFTNKNSPEFTFITYIATVKTEVVPTLNDEHIAYKWFNFEELRTSKLHYGIRNILSDEKIVHIINMIISRGY